MAALDDADLPRALVKRIVKAKLEAAVAADPEAKPKDIQINKVGRGRLRDACLSSMTRTWKY
jgi:hypothetical protein